MKKFWKWKNQTVLNQDNQEEILERTLYLNGPIAEESWFDDEVTPQIFKDELNAGGGNVTVWINSGGGDCVAAAIIYNMLADYKGKVTVKIDGIAASAASVIAMAGDKVLMSPVAMVMIHNPSTVAFGEKVDMEKAIAMLDEVKASIINAYERKTNLSRVQLAHMMDAETWMDANKAVQLGFADEIIGEIDPDIPVGNSMYSEVKVTNSLTSAIAKKCRIEPPEPTKQEEVNNTIPADSLMSRLNLMKNWRN
ncbi:MULTISPECIES: head maturation protease, ClpP-related [Enterococcus]|uniref:head maturation protease, ClpP-related n=1 Tax=Enterococcus TaxID=1350 RepID=UPI001B819167|nr:head maturation protease, ClpP-related [Enterococcus faecalis]MDK0488495.1 Clp protease ClpP [Enterococcus faecalis]MDK0510375.1 Clp protease ClpP [Enterococcus faecalis]HBC2591164.1 Clp protease ClpP [Enterococcus faecalis]